MDTNQQLKVKEKKVKLVDGEFSATQALDILTALINQKINFHKIQKHQHWEQDHTIDETPYIKRIQELEEEKKAMLRFLSENQNECEKFSIKGTLTIKPIH